MSIRRQSLTCGCQFLWHQCTEHHLHHTHEYSSNESGYNWLSLTSTCECEITFHVRDPLPPLGNISSFRPSRPGQGHPEPVVAAPLRSARTAVYDTTTWVNSQHCPCKIELNPCSAGVHVAIFGSELRSDCGCRVSLNVCKHASIGENSVHALQGNCCSIPADDHPDGCNPEGNTEFPNPENVGSDSSPSINDGVRGAPNGVLNSSASETQIDTADRV